jgi:hypothetical protein
VCSLHNLIGSVALIQSLWLFGLSLSMVKMSVLCQRTPGFPGLVIMTKNLKFGAMSLNHI